MAQWNARADAAPSSRRWWPNGSGTPLHLIVLAPPPEVSEQRDAQRSAKHVAAFFRHLGPLLDSELAGTGRWLDSGQQAPLDTVRAILAHGTAGRL